MQAEFSVTFDRATIKISDKIWNLTLGLMKKVLENIGMDEGEWFLKVPHRVRKKGPEKFKALRLVDYGGAKAIRVRCKPQGNETSFEYTLVPPSGTNVDLLFNLFQRVHPKTLKTHDTLAMAAATYFPEVRELASFPAARLLPLPPLPPKTETIELKVEEPQKEEFNKTDISKNISPTNTKIVSIAENISSPEVISSSGEIEKISSLAIKEAFLLSDQEVLDRALVAISFVSENGYAKKNAASESIIQNLEISNFIKTDSAAYRTLPGAMRALTMGLKKSNYIDQIYCGIGSESVRGYELTEKGKKRICALKRFLSDNLISKINSNWDGPAEALSETQAEEIPIVNETAANTRSKESAVDQVENYNRLESLVASLKEANDQIVDANEFIENLNSEKNDLSAEAYGLDMAIQEQNKMKEEIEKRIQKLKEKQDENKKQIKIKEREIEDWKAYQLPYNEEKDRLKKEIEKLASSVGIGLKS